MNATTVSVIIPSAGLPTVLQNCLESLGRVTSDAMEVVVALDGGDSGRAKGIEQLRHRDDWPWPLRWVALEARRGPGAARNRGANEACGHHLIFLDDDMTVESDFVSRHLDLLAQERDAAVVGAILTRCIGYTGAYRYSIERFWERRHNRLIHDSKVGFWDCFTGNLSIEAELFRRIGGFDEAMTACEDLELGLRLARAGVRLVYDPRAVAIQHSGKSPSGTIRDCEARGVALARLWRCYPEARSVISFARPEARRLQKMALRLPGRCESLAFILPWLPASRWTDRLCAFMCELAQNRAARRELADESLWTILTESPNQNPSQPHRR
jgi:GT2 family glycosyltransferase